jgi:hypothetical protein
MPDGAIIAGPPLLMDERTAAAYVSMTTRDFRSAVAVGMLPGGRIPTDFARAGLLDATQAARLATLGPLWHRGEIDTRAAHLWGLESKARLGQAARLAAAEEALHDYQPGRRAPAPRQGRHPRG